jgi:hypothetical protein
VSVQRALRKYFGEDMEGAPGPTDEQRPAWLLNQRGEYRVVQTKSGPHAVGLFDFTKAWLPQHGYRILTDDVL